MDDQQRTEAIAAWRSQQHDWGMRAAPEVEQLIARRSLAWCAISPAAGAPIAAAHGVPTWLAVLIAALEVLGYVLLAMRWNPAWAWRWYAVAALTVVTFYPGLVWVGWYGFAALFAVIPILIGYAVWRAAWAPERRHLRNPQAEVHLSRSMQKQIRKGVDK